MGTLVMLVAAAVSVASATIVEDGWLGGLQREYSSRKLVNCLQEVDFTCLRTKLYSNLDKMLHKRAFQLFNGVVVEHSPVEDPEEGGRSLNDIPDSSPPPRSHDEANRRLDQLLMAGVSRMLQSRSVKFDLPTGLRLRVYKSPSGLFGVDFGTNNPTISRALGEGRGKDKGGDSGHHGGGMICFFLMAVAVILAKTVGTHAMMVSVAAIIIAAIHAFKGMGGGKETTSHVEIHPHHHGGSRRVMQVSSHMYSPHDMAYGMQRPDEPRVI